MQNVHNTNRIALEALAKKFQKFNTPPKKQCDTSNEQSKQSNSPTQK